MKLLLVTSSWPHVAVAEFLDQEIHYLASAFEWVAVAPMRPKGPLLSGIPRNVTVDYSLAEHLEHTRFTRNHPSRRLTTAARLALPNKRGFGFSRTNLASDAKDFAWIRASLMGRADSTSVAGWATKSHHIPDIAYTFWLGSATVGLRTAWPGVPLVSRVHRTELYAEAHGWQSIPFQSASVRSVDLLATVSDDGCTYLATKYPESHHKVVVRRLGVHDLGAAPPSPAEGRSVRILSASSITPVKRVRLIGQVAQDLARSGRTIEWTHLGDGPGRAELEQSLVQAPEALKVHLKGHVPLAEVHRELSSGNHDVFINLSLSEGAPVSLMEAQCVGLPVVATAVGGTPEVVPERLNELVHPNDPVSVLCAAVLRAAKRPLKETHERRGHWYQRYNADTNYSAWANELAELASSTRPSH